MKRFSNKKFRLKYHLKIKKSDGSVLRYFKTIKQRIYQTIVANSGVEWKLKVVYYPDVYNEGVYFNKSDVLTALKVWTEKDLLDYIEQENW